ncbi:MAG: hypothetical protein OEM62_10530 [Acidobacteriota bacterium]|nr:hypothetical protein [Acidobacteriota bacterium]
MSGTSIPAWWVSGVGEGEVMAEDCSEVGGVYLAAGEMGGDRSRQR